ncbi:hypothetical protein HNV10_16535 [Winogradskyella litoriviva]|uniref:Uncharacterized protein n=1 Tax=Winogradskyella litoriviva TaxID=1220182 RepID=A0ABX2E9U4_9FLAO|nr:hypothetical protein [Winogradskyella litoriviva]NRD24863.1 hypothetical protein [Winogradskyella litoriviva]
MKKLFAIMAFALLPLLVFGQKSQGQQPLPVIEFRDNVKLPLTALERAQIDEVYGEYAEKYIYSDPFRLLSVKNILRNRVVIELVSEDTKTKDCTLLSEVTMFNSFVKDVERDEVFNPENFNPLKYNFRFYSRSAALYHVDNTNYYILIKSQYQ